MKSSILVSALALSISSFSSTPNALPELSISTSEQLGRKVLAALQHTSASAYVALFPALPEFHKIMNDNASLYGNFLPEARDEFTNSYFGHVLPEIEKSFEHLINEGIEKGIDWNSIDYVRVEQSKAFVTTFDSGSVVIVFTAADLEYRILIENVLVINGQWRIGKHVELL